GDIGCDRHEERSCVQEMHRDLTLVNMQPDVNGSSAQTVIRRRRKQDRSVKSANSNAETKNASCFQNLSNNFEPDWLVLAENGRQSSIFTCQARTLQARDSIGYRIGMKLWVTAMEIGFDSTEVVRNSLSRVAMKKHIAIGEGNEVGTKS